MKSPNQKPVEDVRADIIKGIWRDEVYKKDSEGKDLLVKRTEPDHNIITQPMTVLLAALLANDPSLLGGVLYHAIGEGDSSWDTGGIPDPSKFDTQLMTELNRKTPDGISYLKWGQGKAQSGTTTIISDPSRLDSCGLVGRFEPDGFFDGMDIEIIQGTNAGETRTVLSYTQSTGDIVVDTPFPAPIDSTSEYQFVPEVSLMATNVIEIRTTWDYGSPSDSFNFKYIREQGLFGGSATSTADSGLMLDRITHERIFKDPTIKLVRFIDIVIRV